MERKLNLEELSNVSEIDNVYNKRVTYKVSERPQIKCSSDVYEIQLHYWDQDKIDLIEEFKVLFLNRSNRVLQIYKVAGFRKIRADYFYSLFVRSNYAPRFGEFWY